MPQGRGRGGGRWAAYSERFPFTTSVVEGDPAEHIAGRTHWEGRERQSKSKCSSRNVAWVKEKRRLSLPSPMNAEDVENVWQAARVYLSAICSETFETRKRQIAKVHIWSHVTLLGPIPTTTKVLCLYHPYNSEIVSSKFTLEPATRDSLGLQAERSRFYTTRVSCTMPCSSLQLSSLPLIVTHTQQRDYSSRWALLSGPRRP